MAGLVRRAAAQRSGCAAAFARWRHVGGSRTAGRCPGALAARRCTARAFAPSRTGRQRGGRRCTQAGRAGPHRDFRSSNRTGPGCQITPARVGRGRGAGGTGSRRCGAARPLPAGSRRPAMVRSTAAGPHPPPHARWGAAARAARLSRRVLAVSLLLSPARSWGPFWPRRPQTGPGAVARL